ncbi:hypothetical protein KI387_042530, partial [Taxus chinensis]
YRHSRPQVRGPGCTHSVEIQGCNRAPRQGQGEATSSWRLAPGDVPDQGPKRGP